MRQFALIVLVSIAIAVFAGGCRNLPSGFVSDARPGMTKDQAHNRMTRDVYIAHQEFWEDWDHFWMVEYPSRLNMLQIR